MAMTENHGHAARLFGIALLLLLIIAAAIFALWPKEPEFESFYNWTSTLTAESIEFASVSKGYGSEQVLFELEEAQCEALAELIRGIDEGKIQRSGVRISSPEYSLYIKRDGAEYILGYSPDIPAFVIVKYEEQSEEAFGPSGSIWINSLDLKDFILANFN